MPQINKDNMEDHNRQPIGLGNTRILTNYGKIYAHTVD